MKIMQEENIQHVEHQLEKRYQLDAYSCMFFCVRHDDFCLLLTSVHPVTDFTSQPNSKKPTLLVFLCLDYLLRRITGSFFPCTTQHGTHKITCIS